MIYVLGTFARKDGEVRLVREGVWFPTSQWSVFGIYLMLGLGVLAKGPVGFLLPMAMMGLFMLIQTLPRLNHDSSMIGRGPVLGFFVNCLRIFHPSHFLKTLWAMRPLTGAFLVLAIALPWYIMVDRRTGGDFTRMFFLGEHFGARYRIAGEPLRWHLVLSGCNSNWFFFLGQCFGGRSPLVY